jgi:hypothetical protein
MTAPVTPRPARPADPDDPGSRRAAAQRRISSRAEFRQVLRRAGYSTTRADSLLRDLPDPIDFDRDAPTLLDRGVTLDRLINAVGGSP